MKQKAKLILGAIIGNMLEWYDFLLYALFATILGQHFFPKEDPRMAVMSVFGVFAIGYFARPIGGALIGHIGDTLSRKKGLVLSLLVMGVATALVGVLPSYASIGIWAPILLILLRFIQGLAVGGEFPGSMVILTEDAHPKHKAFMSTLGFCGALMGMLLASGIANLLSSVMSHTQLTQWGWRIPFLLGLLLAVVGLYLRMKVLSDAKLDPNDTVKVPSLELFKEHKKSLLKAFMILTPGAVYSGILTTVLVSYVTHYHGFSLSLAFKLSMSITAILLILFPSCAILVDKLGSFRRWQMFGFALIGITTYPLYLMMHFGITATFWAFILMTIIYSIAMCPVLAYLVSLFPKRIRYSGFAVMHGLTFSLIGGTAPLVLTALAYHCGPISPAYYGTLSIIVGLIGLVAVKRVYNVTTE